MEKKDFEKKEKIKMLQNCWNTYKLFKNILRESLKRLQTHKNAYERLGTLYFMHMNRVGTLYFKTLDY